MLTDKKLRKFVLRVQRIEETEHLIYMRLAASCKDAANAEVLRKMGVQEKGHARYWQNITQVEQKPDMFRVYRTLFLVKLLGLTFVLKLMEKREGTGSKTYNILAESFPEAKQFAEEELEHEQVLLRMLDEEGLQYVGSVVLGLNDALVELTGALAGFTLALSDNKIISLVGLVTGISAAMSMAASDYLASKAEGDPRAKKSAAYTGVAYIFTVAFLIMPYLLLASPIYALICTLLIAVLIIFSFNFYISVAKDLNFKARFLEMTFISLGVATFSFFVGYALKYLLGVDI